MVKSIRIPKTPASAYQPSRKVSALLQAHVRNLEAVARRKFGVTTSKKPRTEAQASAYIAELTRHFHAERTAAPAAPPGAAQPNAVAPAPVAAPPQATRKTQARSARPAGARASGAKRGARRSKK